MLQPKKVKHRKQHKGRMRGKAYRGCNLDFGEFGLQAMECSRITARGVFSHHRAPDRGGANCHDAAREARWQGVDPDLSREARHEEAG
jgi:hypothetical protein